MSFNDHLSLNTTISSPLAALKVNNYIIQQTTAQILQNCKKGLLMTDRLAPEPNNQPDINHEIFGVDVMLEN